MIFGYIITVHDMIICSTDIDVRGNGEQVDTAISSRRGVTGAQSSVHICPVNGPATLTPGQPVCTSSF